MLQTGDKRAKSNAFSGKNIRSSGRRKTETAQRGRTDNAVVVVNAAAIELDGLTVDLQAGLIQIGGERIGQVRAGLGLALAETDHVARLPDRRPGYEKIAAAVGYENRTFFNQQFRDHYGFSPGEYRRMRQGK